ncbi:uncharacterized protein N0V89_000403 [Didymosphaeria variabile]|uniref:Uncharacterized protein n=1 Tax=Didymosphaeria variabile TaxID=1932322 RepID=A0A9W8XWQ3_9PLEO|nr:uncharacterized protein N0V89_000403 [Didymosphaeria variabile]KAJ4359847.1 hypothetical protein N0V89_000403 [Didymosphaeria variabile]
MRQPQFRFLYRMQCQVAKEEFDVGAPHKTGWIRSIVNILSGQIRGPNIEAEILPGGADWAQVVEGTHSMKLDARYVAKTNDGHYLYIESAGLYRPGPGTAYAQSDQTQAPPRTVTQDDVEFFTRVRIEAGQGPYNWLNGLVSFGVLVCEGETIVLDAYHLTNFADKSPEDVVAKASR